MKILINVFNTFLVLSVLAAAYLVRMANGVIDTSITNLNATDNPVIQQSIIHGIENMQLAQTNLFVFSIVTLGFLLLSIPYALSIRTPVKVKA